MAEENGRKILCPLPEYGRKNEETDEWESDYFIAVPAKWRISHQVLRDEVIEKWDGELGQTDGIKFAISMAVADDWNLPGLGGNPENWDFSGFDLEIARWVNSVVHDSLAGCWYVKKNLLKL